MQLGNIATNIQSTHIWNRHTC